MPWLSVILQTTAVLVAFWGPGAVLLGLCRVRGLLLVAVAPAVTTGLLGLGAVAAGVLGVPWTGATAAVLVALTCGAVWWWRSRPAVGGRAGTRRPYDVDGWRALARSVTGRLTTRPGPWAVGVAVAVAAGTLLQLVPVVVGWRSPASILDGHDALFHLTALQFVRDSGLASSFRVSAVAGDALDGRFYPAGWHAVAAVVPVWAGRGATFAVAAVVPACVMWPVGLAALARTALPHERSTHVVAPLLATAGTAPPVLLVLQAGVVANAFALAMAPAVLAWAVSGRAHRGAGPAVSLVVAAGLALSHPGTLVCVALVALPWVLARVRATTAPGGRRWTWNAVVVGGVVGFAAAVASLAPPDYGRFGGSTAWRSILGDLGSGAVGLTAGDGTLLVVLALAGAVLAWRRGPRWLTVAAVLATAGYLLMRLRLEALAQAVAPWFGEPRRIGPVFSAVAVVLAALAIARFVRLLLDRKLLQTAAHPAVVAITVAAALAAVPVVQATRSVAAQAVDAFGWGDGPRYLTSATLDLVRRVDLDGRVLGHPETGAAHAYGLTGRDAVLRSPWSQATPDVEVVAAHLEDLTTDPRVCAALDRMGARYLWVDTSSGGGTAPVLDVVPDAGVRVVDRAGTVAVLEVTAC